jgi:hypothetical protein
LYSQDHISTAIDYSTPAGTLTWGNLLDKANASAQLTNYKNGDYANSEWTCSPFPLSLTFHCTARVHLADRRLALCVLAIECSRQ